MEDSHPNPDEIKPYVAIGPTKELSVTVHKSTFDTGFIAVTIIFIVVIVAILVICIYFATQQVAIPAIEPLPPTNSTDTSNFGAAPFATYSVESRNKTEYTTIDQCLSNDHTRWVDNACACVDPFFGPTCNLEKHHSSYFGVGVPNEDTLGITVLDETIASGKSFHPESCSVRCDAEDTCTGFIYHSNGLCTLLEGDIIIPSGETIPYTKHINPTLYTKSSDRLKFEGDIFLSEFPHHLPARFWLSKKGFKYIHLFPREISTIDFFPNHINIHGCYTGIYCLHPFTIKDVPTLLQYSDPENCYIHYPRTDLLLPDHWRYYLPVYVVYIPS